MSTRGLKPPKIPKPAPTLAIINDNHSDQWAIYVDGVLRGEYTELLHPEELFDCYSTYASGAVVIELHRIESTALELWDDAGGCVLWPDQIAALNIPF